MIVYLGLSSTRLVDEALFQSNSRRLRQLDLRSVHTRPLPKALMTSSVDNDRT
jgi:hypothetical protein